MPADPDQLVLLASTRTEFEASTMAEALRAAGIECRVFAAAAMGMQWEGGIANNVRIMVRRADLDAARETLAVARRDARAIDWSTVDVGEPEEDLPPPRPRIAGLSPALYRVRAVGMAMLMGVMMLSVGMHPFLALAVTIILAASGWQSVPRQAPPLTASR